MMAKETTMRRIALMLAGSSVFFLGLTGCGNGGGSAPKLQQKTAIITFSTVSGAHAAPLEGISVAMKLPAGTTITDMASAVTGHNSSGTVIPGKYSPIENTVTFAVSPAILTPPSNFILFGDFATLTCIITPGVTLEQSSFSVAVSDIQMTGKDPGGNSIGLEKQIPVRLSVSFGY